MGFHINFFFNPIQKILHLNLSGLLQRRILCMLIGQPDLSGPEAGCPVSVFCGLIKSIFTVSLLKAVSKFRKIPNHLGGGRIQGGFHLAVCYFRLLLQFFKCNPTHNLISFCLTLYARGSYAFYKVFL